MLIWEKILFKGHSQFNGEVKVVESNGRRRLVASGFTQSQSLNKDGRTGLRYWDSMVPENLVLDPDSRVLILGLGAGTVAKIITKKFGPIAIDGVEIDPLMVELGKRYFSLNEKNLNIYIEDAAKFVKNSRYKYDLICLDIFIGGQVPVQLQSREFLEDTKALLKPGGQLAINKIFSGSTELEAFRSFIKSIFPTAKSFTVRGKVSLDNVICYIENK